METHILFIILGLLLIAILIGVGIWSARREKSQIFSNTFSTRPPSSPINSGLNSEVPSSLATTEFNASSNSNSSQSTNDNFAQIQQQEEIEQSVNNIKISLPGQDQVAFAETQSSYHPHQAQAAAQTNMIMQEPAVQIQLEQQPIQHIEIQTVEEAQPITQTPQIITLYVVAAEGQQFYGETIVQHLEALGFEYGDYQIYHRHIDNSSSPILFSVANMMQPGTFDLHTLDQFTTVGLAFFMQLPSTGNDVVNLRLMIRTVESFAQSVGGFVLNEQHQLFDDTSRQAYLLQVSQQS